eukprot:gene14733-biopygen4058
MLGQARVNHSQRWQPLQPFSTSPAGPVDRSRDQVDSRSAWPPTEPDLPRARRRLRPRRPAPRWFPHQPCLRQCDGRARAPAPPPTAGEGRREPGRDARARRVQRRGVQWQVSRNGRPVPIRIRRAGLPESPAPDRGRASNATARVMTPCAAWICDVGLSAGFRSADLGTSLSGTPLRPDHRRFWRLATVPRSPRRGPALPPLRQGRASGGVGGARGGVHGRGGRRDGREAGSRGPVSSTAAGARGMGRRGEGIRISYGAPN